ncbi:hypothetical protein ACIRPX_16060 [Streptomyces sp. NPDC101225]|uniref:hypothetical protein n=1 Tax=Streptomyces sp. NPDC101225 TaxID=3366135 RepID=UPI0037F2A275
MAAAVTIGAGYVGALIVVFRRLRAGTLHSLQVTLPGFRLVWDSRDQSYRLRTPVGTFSVNGEPPISSPEGYAAKVENLTEQARKAANEVDRALGEMESALGSRKSAIAELESQLSTLKDSEQQLSERIKNLESVEPEAAREFVNLMDKSLSKREKQGVKRDLYLFALGVVCTIIVSAIFFALS